MSDVTQILQQIESGDPSTTGEMVPLLCRDRQCVPGFADFTTIDGMTTRDSQPANDQPPVVRFQTTQWTLVLAAGAQLLRDEIARTVATPADVEDEIRGLFRTFSGWVPEIRVTLTAVSCKVGEKEPETVMTDQNTCPKCGAALPAESPEGLCPKCLLQAGLDESGTDPEHDTPTLLPDSAAARPETDSTIPEIGDRTQEDLHQHRTRLVIE